MALTQPVHAYHRITIIEIAQTDEGKEIISVFSQVGYTWGKDSDYDGERDAQAMLKSAGK